MIEDVAVEHGRSFIVTEVDSDPLLAVGSNRNDVLPSVFTINLKRPSVQMHWVRHGSVIANHPRADSVPNLELETGDVVGAGHASATGRFDDEQLFYLQSRGIPDAIARLLVVRGFFVDVLIKINDPDLSASLMRRIESKLGIVDHE